jgi:hypothetical protein
LKDLLIASFTNNRKRGFFPAGPMLVVDTLRQSKHLRKYWFESILGLGIIGVLIYAALTLQFFVAGGALTYPSLISYALCFMLTSLFLNRQGLKFIDRIFYCFATMASGIVLFEMVYHYAYGVLSFNDFLHYELFFLGNQSANGYFSLDWYLVILVVPFIGWRYMSLNKILFGVTIFSAFVMFFWVATGYPQPLYPQWFPAYSTLINVIQKGDTSQIVFYGELFNGLAKIIAIIPALLFYKVDQISKLQSCPKSVGS